MMFYDVSSANIGRALHDLIHPLPSLTMKWQVPGLLLLSAQHRIFTTTQIPKLWSAITSRVSAVCC